MTIRKIAVGAGAIACLLGTSSAAIAASAPSGGPTRMFVTYQTPTKSKILITGAIADYGEAISEDPNGKPDPNGNLEKVTLKQGGFVIDDTALDKTIQKQFSKEPINTTNCSVALTGTGPGKIETGTGAYAGISGNAKIALTVAGIAPKTKAGKCDLSKSFYGSYQAVTVTVKVSFN